MEVEGPERGSHFPFFFLPSPFLGVGHCGGVPSPSESHHISVDPSFLRNHTTQQDHTRVRGSRWDLFQGLDCQISPVKRKEKHNNEK